MKRPAQKCNLDKKRKSILMNIERREEGRDIYVISNVKKSLFSKKKKNKPQLMESFGLKLQNLKLICVIATVRS